jgi:hypothetical protein
MIKSKQAMRLPFHADASDFQPTQRLLKFSLNRERFPKQHSNERVFSGTVAHNDIYYALDHLKRDYTLANGDGVGSLGKDSEQLLNQHEVLGAQGSIHSSGQPRKRQVTR